MKNPLAMRKTWVPSLGWEDPLEKGKALQYPGLENSTDWIVHGVAESDTTERLSLLTVGHVGVSESPLRVALHWGSLSSSAVSLLCSDCPRSLCLKVWTSSPCPSVYSVLVALGFHSAKSPPALSKS